MSATEADRADQVGFVAPTIDADSELWWNGLAAHRIVLPKCLACDRCWFPPTPGCAHCGAAEQTTIDAAGRGFLYSWVVVNRALDPAFQADVPYTIALVELEEGPRVYARLLPATVVPTAGASLAAVFYEVEGRTLLGFGVAT